MSKLSHTLVSTLAAAAFSTSLISTSASASEFELSLSNSSVYAEATSSDQAPAQVALGYLYHEESRNVLNLDFHAQNKSELQGNATHVGVGVRAIGYHEHDTDGLGLALGGFGEIELQQVPGLSIGGSAHYSPSILTFSDVDNFLWLEAEAAYAVIPNADVLLGYRYIKNDYENGGSKSAESSAFIGLKFQF